jgi:MinD-like ATPase involved in chromosome partitioning or flagellar assembly
VRLSVLTAADGAAWEAQLVLAFDGAEYGVTIVRRCVDVVELLAVAASGQAQAVLVAAGLVRFDADAVDRLSAAEVIPIGVVSRDDIEAELGLRALGVEHIVAADADPKVIAAVIEEAIRSGRPGLNPDGTTDSGAASTTGRGFSDPVAATATVIALPDVGGERPAQRGSVIAVWGPTGAPGRTTVAVTLADELARLGGSSLLIDADVYGGVVGPVLGLLDESAGLAALCRQAGASRLDGPTLAAACWQVRSSFRVLTGIPRAERWPELRPSAIASVLSAARSVADFTVVDCGFCLESDEELSFDSIAPRRNGATLAILDVADLIVVVGAADPLGLQRLARGLTELRDAEVSATSWVLLNKVRGNVVPGNLESELAEALRRFTGRVPAGFLPFDPEALDLALAAGKTLAEARPSSPLRRAVVEVAAAIAGVQTPASRRHRRRS